MLLIYKTRRKREPVKVFPDGREVCEKTKAGFIEYRRRIHIMRLRQNNLCNLCGEPMADDDCTFEHEEGRGIGGGHRDDRIERDGHSYNSVAHWHCNVKKASMRLSKYKEVA